MELKQEHQGLHATFLDLEANVINNIFVYKLYDKRDAFPFSIVRMPYISSNIPYNIFYNTILSEILRIARCSLLYEDFYSRRENFVSGWGTREQMLFLERLRCSDSWKSIHTPLRNVTPHFLWLLMLVTLKELWIIICEPD